MKSFTIATGGLAAGLIIAGWSVLAGLADPDAGSADLPLDAPAPADPARSVAFWEQRVDATPGSFLDRTQLGIAQTALARDTGDLDLYGTAEATLRTALDSAPAYAPARLGLGRALHEQHRFHEAAHEALAVLRSTPSSSSALALRGDAALELGDLATAADAYGRLEGNDRSAPVISRLARLAFATGDPHRAARLADEALNVARDSSLPAREESPYWFLRGHFRFEVGQIDAAIDDLERALELRPAAVGPLEELATMYWAAGRTDAAREAFETLIGAGTAPDVHGRFAELLVELGDVGAAAEQERIARELLVETIDRYPAERRHAAGFLATRDPSSAVELAEADLLDRRDAGAFDTLAWALHQAGRTDEAADMIDAALEGGIRDASVLYHAGAIAAADDRPDDAAALLTAALDLNPHFDPVDGPAAVALLESLGR